MGFLQLLSSSLSLLSFLLLILSPPTTTTAQPQPPLFKCTSKLTCQSLVGYVSPNATTLAHIQSLFQVPTLLSLLGVNSLPPTTPPTHPVLANQTVTIPFPCRCINGSGVSDNVPKYVVVKDDGLYHIASQVFSGLVTYPQIQAVNNIPDANLIVIGDKLWVPLPCSCDDVEGREVVHYGHVVADGSSVEGIAAQFGVAPATVMSVNGITDPKKLIAGQVLDVPLTACSSSVKSNSPDYPLLAANGTYVYTANNCVKCSCDPSNNFTLQCQPSEMKPANWSSCPSSQCSSSSLLGNSTSSRCSRSTCAYAGYTNNSILTTLAVQNTCPAAAPPSKNGAWKIQERDWSRSLLLLTIQLLMMVHRFL